MKIIKVPSLLPQYSEVVLFTETSKDDYLFNHQLSFVSDTDDDETEIKARPYMSIPDEAIVSDRQCLFKSVSITAGKLRR